MSTWPASGSLDWDGPLKAYIDAQVAAATALATSAGAGVGCSVSRAAAQSIPASTLTNIVFDTEQFDTDGFRDPGTPTRVTIPTGLGGLYVVTGQVAFDPATSASAGGSERTAAIFVNGVGVFANPAPATGYSTQVSAVVQLSAGDYLQLVAWQDSPGSLNTRGAATRDTALTVARIGN